jgi:hypothetical protein
MIPTKSFPSSFPWSHSHSTDKSSIRAVLRTLCGPPQTKSGWVPTPHTTVRLTTPLSPVSGTTILARTLHPLVCPRRAMKRLRRRTMPITSSQSMVLAWATRWAHMRGMERMIRSQILMDQADLEARSGMSLVGLILQLKSDALFLLLSRNGRTVSLCLSMPSLYS